MKPAQPVKENTSSHTCSTASTLAQSEQPFCNGNTVSNLFKSKHL